MGTRTIRLDEDVYERLKSRKSDDETFSDAVDRLIDDWTLLDFAAEEPPMDPETHRELLEDAEELGVDEARENLDRLGVDADE